MSTCNMGETDIRRAAHLLIQQHGDGAELTAAKHLDATTERGDPSGEAVWKRVPRAISYCSARRPGKWKPVMTVPQPNTYRE